ncbi:hypothetical protein M3J09_005545 [Ascochyta lentis]
MLASTLSQHHRTSELMVDTMLSRCFTNPLHEMAFEC